jgi:hypothetical protein
MRQVRRTIVLLSAVVSLLLLADAQESASLGEVARQTRQHKSKDAPGQTPAAAKKSKVITNDELPEHAGLDAAPSESNREYRAGTGSASVSALGKRPAEEWKTQILAQKSFIKSLESNITKLNDSVQFAPANCVAGCVQWNERQKQKQQEVERMRSQLQTQKQRLASMQESARQQGYGSSVYDP